MKKITTDQNTVYVTYFDSGYLARGLTLIQSLRANDDHSQVWILCLDEVTHTYLVSIQIPGIRPIPIREFENSHPFLSPLKAERSPIEYIFSIGPTFIRWVMGQTLPGCLVIYLDADLYFFGDPRCVINEMGAASVGIIEHGYPRKLEHKLQKYGKFNVGWVGFRNDLSGERVLSWWAEECIKWCFDKPENGKYADQGYLDSFVNFENVKILKNPGFNLAPWNTGSRTLDSEAVTDRIMVDKTQPLTFFHFHGLRETKNWFVTSQLAYKDFASKLLLSDVYLPYCRELQKFNKILETTLEGDTNKQQKRGNGARGMIFNLQKRLIIALSILTNNAVRKTN